MCKKSIDKNIFHLSLGEPHEERIDWIGNGIFDGIVCKSCSKNVLKTFKNKIWVESKYKRILK